MPATLAAIPAFLAASGTAAGAATAAGAGFAGLTLAGGATAAAGITTAGTLATSAFVAGSFSVGTFLATTAISLSLSVAGSLVTKALAGKPEAGSQAMQSTFSEPTTPRFYYFGRVKTGGSLGFVDVGPTDNDLYRVIITDCHECDAIEENFLNNQKLTIGAGGWVQSPTKWRNEIQILTKPGSNVQTAHQPLIAQFPGIWTAQHRMRGLCNVYIRQTEVPLEHVFRKYPNGSRGEQYTQVRRAGKDFYDPRTGTSGWTRNAALIVLWALTHPSFGGLSLDEFNLPSWEAAADECDQQILNADGNFQPQWTLSGRIQVPQPGRQSTEVASTIADMLASFDAEIYEDPEADGKLSIRIGAPDPIEDGPFGVDEILSWEDEEGAGLLDGYDALRIRYIEPRLGYVEHLTPAWGDPSPQSILVVPRTFIDNYSQAQRIAKRTWLRTIAARTAKASTNLAGLLLPISSGIEVDLPILPSAETYRVNDAEIAFSDEEVGVQLSLERVDPDHNNWDPATEEVELELPPILDGDGGIVAAPMGLRAAADKAADGTVRVVWDPVDNTGVEAEIEWSEAGAEVWTGTVTLADARLRVGLIDAAAAAGLIDVRVRFVTSTAATSWTMVEDVDPLTPLSAQAAPGISGPTSSSVNSVETYAVSPASTVGVWKVELQAIADPYAIIGETEWFPTAAVAAQATINVPIEFLQKTDEDPATLTARVRNLSDELSAPGTLPVFVAGSGNEA